MRISMATVASALACVLGVGAAACAAPAEEEAVDDDVAAVVRPRTVVVSATPGDDVRVEPDRLVFRRVGHEDLLARRPDDVLVCGTGDGFLRRVRSVHGADGAIVVETSPASFDDAIEQGRVRKRLAAGGGSTLATEDLGQSPPETALVPERFTGEAGGVELVEGHFSYHPDIDVDLLVRGGEVKSARVLASGTASAGMKVRFDLHRPGALPIGSFVRIGEPGWKLASLPPYRTVAWVGQVPVIVVVRVELLLGYLLQIGGDVRGEVALDVAASLAAGLELRDGAWRSLGSSTLDMKPGAHVDVTRRVLAGDVTLTAQLSVSFYDLAGPTVALQAYAGIGHEGGAGHDEWFGQVGLRSLVGVEVAIFGTAVGGYRASPFDRQRRISLGEAR
ncbi:MAG TPA: hypothetical protein VLT33_34755 [Labilithrix sp.]|nr:hypothetical protein [Labilithrix sp.]